MLGASIPLKLRTEGAQPCIMCFKKDMPVLFDKLENFIQKKPVEVSIPLDKAVLRYLCLYGKTLLEGLSVGLKITQSSNGLIVSGEKRVVENRCARIHHTSKGSFFFAFYTNCNRRVIPTSIILT
jgi:hypothetical protein